MDAILELQGAIITRLRNDTSLAVLVGQNIYDNPPADDNGSVPPARYPYVSLGPASSNAESAECIDAEDIIFQIDAWSAYPGRKQVAEIADAIRRALHQWEPPLIKNALVTFDYWRTDYIRIPPINHASIRYTALIEKS